MKTVYAINGAASAKTIPLVILVLVVGSLIINSFVIVQPGHVGVVRTLGAVRLKPMQEGLNTRKPFIDQVEQMDVRLTTENEIARASSKDLQIVTTDVTVQYSLVGEVAPLTYQKIGIRAIVAGNLVKPAIQESVKAVTAKYTAEQLITDRESVKLGIQDAITRFIDKTLEEKGVQGGLTVANVAITDFNFSDEFNKAIELKVKAEQEALKAENEKKKTITEAEAQAEQLLLEADASAYKIEAESVARAEAIKREAEALRDSPEVIQLRAIETWDGVLPQFMGGDSGAIPFINLGGAMKKGAMQ